MSELREMLVGGGSDGCVPTNANAKDGGVGVVIHHSGRPQAESVLSKVWIICIYISLFQ